MIATIICILILTIWLSLSVTLFVRRKISAKKNGTPDAAAVVRDAVKKASVPQKCNENKTIITLT